jgi:L-ascorbate metabolism protein UlaG (beta-lactamase superfamily)
VEGQPTDRHTAAARSSVRWLGHSTVLVTLDGTRLLTDPLLRRRVAHLRRRVPLPAERLTDVDAVLLSHGHHDHLDLPSLRRLGPGVPILVPRGLGGLLRRQGFAAVHEVEPGDTLELGNVRIEAMFAAHDGARPPLPARAPALGYALHGSRRVYFAGDTDLFPEMDGLVSELDVALIPIWGWGSSLGRGEHLDPEGAAEAIAMLRPRVAVPIHWGTYAPIYLGVRVPPAFLVAPLGAFVAAAARLAPDVVVHALSPGQALALD